MKKKFLFLIFIIIFFIFLVFLFKKANVFLMHKSVKSVMGPHVIKTDNGYKMWFKESIKTERDVDTNISFASSPDGINWVHEKYFKGDYFLPNNKSSWNYRRFGTPSVLKKNGIYKMWYMGENGKFQQIGLATSSTEIFTDRYKNNPVLKTENDGWSSVALIAPFVLYDEGIYKMWYRGSENFKQTLSSIGYATSTDGIKWNRLNKAILKPGKSGDWDDKLVGGPSILKRNNLYYMWYSGNSYKKNKIILEKTQRNKTGYGKQIGYATSSDGILWQKYKKGPVLKLGESGEWDSLKVDNPFVLYDEGIYKMWYRGKFKNKSAIGYATSSDGIFWNKYFNNPVLTSKSK